MKVIFTLSHIGLNVWGSPMGLQQVPGLIQDGILIQKQLLLQAVPAYTNQFSHSEFPHVHI